MSNQSDGRCIVTWEENGVTKRCPGKRKWCGNCHACYFKAIRAIKKGETTREKLIKRGLMLPSKPGNRSKSAMAKALSK